MQKVYSARDPVEAELLKGYLSSNGVAVTVQGSLLWGARGVLPITAETAPSLWVEEPEVERALRLIKEWAETNEAPSTSTWTCKKCGESNEGQFSACWKCGTNAEERLAGTDEQLRGIHPTAERANEPGKTQDLGGNRAYLTIAIGVASVLASSQFLSPSGSPTWKNLGRSGFLSALEVWSGKYWVLGTSSLVHLDYMTLAFCLGWFLFLGRRIELRQGLGRFSGFVVLSAAIAQGASLAVQNVTVPGLLSIVCAAFAFNWATGDLSDHSKKPGLAPAAFIVSLLVFLIAAPLKMKYKLNVAYPAGAATGMALAYGFVLKRYRLVAFAWLAVTLTVATSSLFWLPWSSDWLAHKSVEAGQFGNTEGAVEFADKAVERGGRNESAWMARGIAYGQMFAVDKALESFRHVVDLNDKYSGGYYGEGVAFYQLHDYEKAIKVLNEALRLDRDFVGAYSMRGWARSSTSSFNAAKADFSDALRLKPDQASALIGRAAIAQEMRDPKGADADLKQALDLLSVSASQEPQPKDVHYDRALAYFFTHDYGKAEQELTKLLELRHPLPTSFFALGWVHEEMGVNEKAIEDFQKGLKIDPRDDWGHLGLGVAYLNQGSLENALQAISQTIEVNPGFAKAYGKRGIAHLRRGELEPARQDFDKAIELNPRNAEAYFFRGATKLKGGDVDSAEVDRKKAVGMDSSFEARKLIEP